MQLSAHADGPSDVGFESICFAFWADNTLCLYAFCRIVSSRDLKHVELATFHI